MSIVIKGAGEMASGIAHRLFMAEMTRICMIEIAAPLCVRRQASFCEAIYERQVEVEGVLGTLVHDRAGLAEAWTRRQIGVMIDPEWKIIAELKPDVVVDAILAKRNLGSFRNEARAVIGIGPGFSAPDVVHAVVESNRGPNLGRVIYEGLTEPFTGTPSVKSGYSWERVLRAPHAGTVRHALSIGDTVKTGDVVLYVNDTPVRAAMDGTLRGLIREIPINEREKLGDIEPQDSSYDCRHISDKAMAIGEGVLEAIRHLLAAHPI